MRRSFAERAPHNERRNKKVMKRIWAEYHGHPPGRQKNDDVGDDRWERFERDSAMARESELQRPNLKPVRPVEKKVELLPSRSYINKK